MDVYVNTNKGFIATDHQGHIVFTQDVCKAIPFEMETIREIMSIPKTGVAKLKQHLELSHNDAIFDDITHLVLLQLV